VYYLGTQFHYQFTLPLVHWHANWWAKAWWDNLGPPSWWAGSRLVWGEIITGRHWARGYEEGLRVACGMMLINCSLRRRKPQPGRIERALAATRVFPTPYTPLRWWMVPLLPVTINLASVPGALLGLALTVGVPGLLNHFGVHWHINLHLNLGQYGTSWWAHLTQIFWTDWKPLVIGTLGGVLFARRAFYPVAATSQATFIDRRLARDRGAPPEWLYPVWYVDRYREAAAKLAARRRRDPAYQPPSHAALAWIMPAVALTLTALAAEGGWVRLVVAAAAKRAGH
jgi:hypothetical protein